MRQLPFHRGVHPLAMRALHSPPAAVPAHSQTHNSVSGRSRTVPQLCRRPHGPQCGTTPQVQAGSAATGDTDAFSRRRRLYSAVTTYVTSVHSCFKVAMVVSNRYTTALR